MMIVYSKAYSKACRELESELKSLIHNFAYDRGLSCFFIEDSRIIQEGIGNISSRIASLLEETSLIKHQIGARKKFDEVSKKKGAKK